MEKSIQKSSTVIAGKDIRPWRDYKKFTKFCLHPTDFRLESTTVWSFKDRGNWASHTPQYRGNWSPYVVRNILERYSHIGDLVLDPMVGGGTTPVECLLTGRNSICCDINPNSVNVTKDRLEIPSAENVPMTQHLVFTGDARNLQIIDNESIDLIATHPPYANMIRYSDQVNGDLSRFDYQNFFKEFQRVIVELHRVLKNGKYCAILIGDTHNKGHFVPLANRMLIDFLKAGFILKEDVIKIEWNCQSDNQYAFGNRDFLLTMHEHLYIFEKVASVDKERYVNSSIKFLTL